jgi:hypothetical protein
LIFVLAAGGVFVALRRGGRLVAANAAPLSDEERDRLEDILGETPEGGR